MKNNIEKYKQTTKENLLDIKNILNNLKLTDINISLYEKILNNSTFSVANRWQSGKKYSRTLFIQEAFRQKYPKKYIELSLSVDAMVNILDDLLDEDLKPKEKQTYVIEFLRIFSVYNKKTNIKISKETSLYINKLITLAVAENNYHKDLKKTKELDKLVEKSADLLICRGMDIDIFLQIALLDKKTNNNDKKYLEKVARIFRALNILKKDINDIEHDLKNNAETAIIIVRNKNNINFKEYLKKTTNNLEQLLEKNTNKIKNNSFLANNFQKMFLKKKKEILNFIK